MLKSIRKHNKWLMVGFGVLLMVTWLVQPTLNQLNKAYDSRVVGKLDGQRISARDMATASQELAALKDLARGFTDALGLEDHGVVHWMILAREAEEGGFVGGERDGEEWEQVLATLTIQLAYEKYKDLAPQVIRIPQFVQPLMEEARPKVKSFIGSAAGRQRLTFQQTNKALAKARGVTRMIERYRNAGRLSDRAAILKAREFLDAAKVDYVFIPAERLIDSIANPDDATIREHFDKYKTVKPGEGEYGVGYLLPTRVKLEWMKMDRAAIEAAVSLDPVEVRRRFNQGKAAGKFTGDFAAAKAGIEAEMKGEVVERVFQEAQVAVQTEILKATKVLDPDGKYKKLPADWEAHRPKFENIAPAVAEAVRRTVGVAIPLPAVTVKAADWLTREDLLALPDIGRSMMRAGGLPVSFDQLVFATREIPGVEPGFLTIQTGVPLTETFLQDGQGNRYYMTVLAVRGESAPDSVDEKRELLVKDWKKIRAFEGLKARESELRTSAVNGGLDAIIAAFPAASAPATPDPATAADPKYKALEIVKNVAVQPFNTQDQIMGTEGVNTKVLEAAVKLNPLLPPEQIPVDGATLSIPISKRLGLAVTRILSPDPVTIEKYRQNEQAVVTSTLRKELSDATPKPEDDPFSFNQLLKRHRYLSGEKDIKTPDDLKKDESVQG